MKAPTAFGKPSYFDSIAAADEAIGKPIGAESIVVEPFEQAVVALASNGILERASEADVAVGALSDKRDPAPLLQVRGLSPSPKPCRRSGQRPFAPLSQETIPSAGAELVVSTPSCSLGSVVLCGRLERSSMEVIEEQLVEARRLALIHGDAGIGAEQRGTVVITPAVMESSADIARCLVEESPSDEFVHREPECDDDHSTDVELEASTFGRGAGPEDPRISDDSSSNKHLTAVLLPAAAGDERGELVHLGSSSSGSGFGKICSSTIVCDAMAEYGEQGPETSAAQAPPRGKGKEQWGSVVITPGDHADCGEVFGVAAHIRMCDGDHSTDHKDEDVEPCAAESAEVEAEVPIARRVGKRGKCSEHDVNRLWSDLCFVRGVIHCRKNCWCRPPPGAVRAFSATAR